MNLTEDQRRAVNEFIAEKCGWTQIKPTLPGLPYWRNPDGYYEGGGTYNPIPDYCASLDACHEALSCVDSLDLGRYRIRLAKMFTDHPYDGMFQAVDATAEQRALALFQTLGGEL